MSTFITRMHLMFQITIGRIGLSDMTLYAVPKCAYLAEAALSFLTGLASASSHAFLGRLPRRVDDCSYGVFILSGHMAGPVSLLHEALAWASSRCLNNVLDFQCL